jgi:hypothetical protein
LRAKDTPTFDGENQIKRISSSACPAIDLKNDQWQNSHLPYPNIETDQNMRYYHITYSEVNDFRLSSYPPLVLPPQPPRRRLVHTTSSVPWHLPNTIIGSLSDRPDFRLQLHCSDAASLSSTHQPSSAGAFTPPPEKPPLSPAQNTAPTLTRHKAVLAIHRPLCACYS